MIELARKRDGGTSVQWHCSVLEEFGTSEQFDLALMTGHAFQCLLEDIEIDRLFQSIRRLLGNGGRFVFETRNPNFEAWKHWTPEHSRVTGKSGTGESFEMFHEVDSVCGSIVEFHTNYFLGSKRSHVVSHSKLRFTSLQELTQMAWRAGLTVSDTWGDWDASPHTDMSPEIVLSLQPG